MAPSIQSLSMIHDSQECIKPIPAFSCCYLLRSCVRHASLYIGSTPDPARRLAQHNGDRYGAAKRTLRENLRPWEMVAIVSGFTSRVAALQFEWAWQNTKVSRHADLDGNATQELGVRICPRTAKEVKRVAKPRTSLTNILANLHLLLRSPYFSKWPIEVRFFSADVHRVWQVWLQRVDGLLNDGIRVVTDFAPDGISEVEGKELLAGAGRVGTLDVGYNSIKEYVEKSQFLLEDGERINCGVCKQRLILQHDIIAVCSHSSCHCAAHLSCLSSHFLKDKDSDSELVPREGTCPTCYSKLEWLTMMKEISLRLRGQAEVNRLFGRRQRAGTPKGQGLKSVRGRGHSEDENESDALQVSTGLDTVNLPPCSDGPWTIDCAIGVLGGIAHRPGGVSSGNDSDATVTPEIETHPQRCRRNQNTRTQRLGLQKSAMINLSDWYDAEVIE
ncbi:GIY-YIG catalytic domain-containing protein [Paracoccidioides lutzii Pb01]|uniref:Structure-specific endonuclease subunit SLX1 n=1 Tax=Paracoccidioides lutzii (strain ATCC MYA-826 / Pb01) TaxID=502779 RepID=SLX1_PARBA|nr:GIY-YIG catalytic domain-containing protein [Paracoccidioides lutzii Pb01]C1H0K4.3 RecName: Full=Structure-specific endonuclease subunit SLX1 [Paracoccidioides lutzii Pb01]EEH33245.2 GIY-YIG catalytic domain-containing protein [Paracoccidioides lutzii Pb01]